MPDSTLYLFPDTNLFIQCFPLEELDWSEWADYDEIILIVSRPVQREIDSQKRRANTRLAKRAQKAYQLFREILASDSHNYTVLTDSPRVTLRLASPSLPSAELNELLDYSTTDDELVGCVHRFQQEHFDREVRLLTHDAGPMMTARTLELKVAPIREDWLLPPEHTDSQREISKLKERIDELEHHEPQFRIWIVDEQGNEIDSISTDHRIYEPMSADDISDCIESLRSQFPIATEFETLESAGEYGRAVAARLLGKRHTYIPPAEESIASYINHDYPEWLKACEEFLSGLHNSLQKDLGQPSFTFVAANEGTRPGNDALVRIIARGDITISPPPIDDDDEESDRDDSGLELPAPPRPPRGKWVLGSPSLNSLASTVSGLSRTFSGLESRINPSFDPSLLIRSSAIANRHDPNAFYYKPHRPMDPAASFSFECQQWRHVSGNESFSGQLFFDVDRSSISGMLSCEIHAENLSNPIRKVVQIRLSINRVKTADHARVLIQRLAGHSK